MKVYSIRPGVILEEIHGVYLLIADQEARKYCPYVRKVNELGAYIWRLLENHYSYQEIISHIQQEFEVSDLQAVESDIKEYIESLKINHYLETDLEKNEI